MIKPPYDNVFGNWEVTTEGDEEGRSLRHLGTHEGYIDEIALALADKVFYSLTFRAVKKIKHHQPVRKSVSVVLDIDSDTWNMSPEDRAKEVGKIFAANNRTGITISSSNYYASFTITLKDKTQLEKYEREQALSKLTDREKEVLGLK